MVDFKSVNDCKYIYYHHKGLGPFTNEINFENEPNVKYCPHKMDSNKMTFDPLDDNIDVLGFGGIIVAKFIKIANHENFEVWINKDFTKDDESKN
jgi:hypothetical protein